MAGTYNWTTLKGLRFQFQKHYDHVLYPSVHYVMSSMHSGELSYTEFDSLFETTARTAVKKDVMTLLKGYIKTKIKANSATQTDASHIAAIVPRFMNNLPIVEIKERCAV